MRMSGEHRPGDRNEPRQRYRTAVLTHVVCVHVCLTVFSHLAFNSFLFFSKTFVRCNNETISYLPFSPLVSLSSLTLSLISSTFIPPATYLHSLSPSTSLSLSLSLALSLSLSLSLSFV